MTPAFLTIWMVSSMIIFMILVIAFQEIMNEWRGFNTMCVLCAQGLGALIAYALY